MEELYRYTVLRSVVPSTEVGIVAAAADADVLLPAGDDVDPYLPVRLPHRNFVDAVRSHEAAPSTSAEYAALLRGLDVTPAATKEERLAQLAQEAGGERLRAIKAGASSLIHTALAARPSSDPSLNELTRTVAAVETFEEWASGDRPAGDWAAGVSRFVRRPVVVEAVDSSVTSGTHGVVNTSTRKRLGDLATSVSALRRVGAKDCPIEETLQELSRAPLGSHLLTRVASVGLEATATELESEGESLIRDLGITAITRSAAQPQWGAVGDLVGVAYKPHPIAGDSHPAGFLDLVRSAMAGENPMTILDSLLDLRDVEAGPSKLEPVARQDLIVARTRHLGYRLAELSHIENIAAGETRDRIHRTETEVETLYVEEVEHEKETEEDLSTTTKDELRNEVEKQTQEKLALSGKVRVTSRGPVEVQAEASAEYSREDSRRTNTVRNHAIEVTEEASTRVRDRVLRRNERRFRRLVAETNQHTFTNETSESRAVQYAWLQKVERVALFNYGERLMYEFVVPEPAAHLRALSARAPGPEVPVRQPPTEYYNKLISGDTSDNPPDITTEWDEGTLHQHFDLERLEEPAAEGWVEQTMSAQGEGAETAPESALVIEEGREGTFMRVSVLASHKDAHVPRLSLVVGPFHLWMNEDSINRLSSRNTTNTVRPRRWEIQLGSGGDSLFGRFFETTDGDVAGARAFSLPEGISASSAGYPTHHEADFRLPFGEGGPDEPGAPYEIFEVDLATVEQKMKPGTYEVQVLATDGSPYAITVAIKTEVSEAGRKAWRQELTAAVVADYWRQYEAYAALALAGNPANRSQLLEDLSAAQAAELREIERDEVKRAALAVVRNQDPEGHDPLSGMTPEVARWYRNNRELADEILFLEQAFEWQHMSFVLYGYQWSDPNDWDLQIFGQRGGDRGFREFLKSGAARVQLPVRPGFEGFVEDYMMDGVPWSGGDRPRIGSPGFLDFITEQSERMGRPGDEVPVPELVDEERETKQPIYWDVVTPTDLVMIKTWDSPDEAPLDRMVPPEPEDLVVALDEDIPNPLLGWTPGRGPVPDEPHG